MQKVANSSSLKSKDSAKERWGIDEG